MTFARKCCSPADITLGPPDGKIGRETDATAIRTPKPRPGILRRHANGRHQRHKRDQREHQAGWGIATAIQHRTSETQNKQNSSSEGSSSFLVSPLGSSLLGFRFASGYGERKLLRRTKTDELWQ